MFDVIKNSGSLKELTGGLYKYFIYSFCYYLILGSVPSHCGGSFTIKPIDDAITQGFIIIRQLYIALFVMSCSAVIIIYLGPGGNSILHGRCAFL